MLRQHPDGLRAPQIVKTLKTDKRTTIYAALYRFTKTGPVRTTGARGKQKTGRPRDDQIPKDGRSLLGPP